MAWVSIQEPGERGAHIARRGIAETETDMVESSHCIRCEVEDRANRDGPPVGEGTGRVGLSAGQRGEGSGLAGAGREEEGVGRPACWPAKKKRKEAGRSEEGKCWAKWGGVVLGHCGVERATLENKARQRSGLRGKDWEERSFPFSQLLFYLFSKPNSILNQIKFK